MKAKTTRSIRRAALLISLALGSSMLPSCLSEHQAMGILDQSMKSAAISAIQQSNPIFGRGSVYGGGYGGGYSESYGGSYSGDGYGGVSGASGYPGGSGSSGDFASSGGGELFEDPDTGAVYRRIR